jgi:glycosyltransferase involved in cell wall biosynthesis
MKIGIITSYFYPAIGGVESVILNQAIELAKTNEVHVFTSDRKGENIYPLEETFKNIHIHRSKTWFRYKYYLAFYPGIIRNILKYDLDVLHVHSIGFFQHDLAVLIEKLVHYKTKLVCTPYGPFMALGNYSFYQKILKFIYLQLEKPINHLYDSVIQINPFQYEQLKYYGINKEKLVLIPPASDEGIFKPINKKIRENLIKKFNFDKKFIIAYMGRIQKYKGLDQIINCLPHLKKEKNIVFAAIGEDAGDKERLLALAKSLGVQENVIFTGRVSEEEKRALLGISEVFVFPSEQEAFGIAMLESMALGNAVVSTRTEGGRYLIKAENGFLYNFGDFESLGNLLKKLIQNNKLRQAMQVSNIKKAKIFSWKKSNHELIKLYKSL